MNTHPLPRHRPGGHTRGKNIQRLREERGPYRPDLQAYFGFEEPQGHLQMAEGKKPPHSGQLVRPGRLAPKSQWTTSWCP